MFLYFFPFFLFFSGISSQQVSQQELLGIPQTSERFQFICGSDPFRFYSDFPCNMYPICINGGFKINVGCVADYQCTPYAQNSVCVNNCCCTVPRIIGTQITTTTRRFFDNSQISTLNFSIFLFLGVFYFL